MINSTENKQETSNEQESWGSHQPVLVKLLKDFPNSRFLELGAGDNSTPLIIENTIYSEHYETNFDWFKKMKSFEKENHPVIFWSSYTREEWIGCPAFEKEWDIAFVDNAPGESRQSNLMKLKGKAKVIVCHDTEELYKPSASAYGWDFSMFKYVFVYDKFNTYTTVVSDTIDFKM
jgi:hypothetical protein